MPQNHAAVATCSARAVLRHLAIGWAVLTLLVGLAAKANAYEVVRDVNSDTPVEKLVLFSKDAGGEHLTFDATGNCSGEILDDGRLKVSLKGTGHCLLNVGWTPGDGRPEGFDMTSYTGLRLVCHLEGSAMVTGRGRNTKPEKQDLQTSGGVQIGLIDAGGMRLWGGSLSAFTPDEKNPTERASVTAYFSLFLTPEAANPSDIRALQFRMPPRGREDRDYAVIIERISLVE